MHNFDPVMSYMKKPAGNLHTEFVGAMLRPAVFSCLMTHRYADQIRGVMEAARLLGQELGRRGKVSDELVKAVAADICSVGSSGKRPTRIVTGRSTNTRIGRPDKGVILGP
jgi:hypothetical protein